MDEEPATLDGQFLEFARFLEKERANIYTITLWRSDYWMRQSKILDDRKVTMTDTGIAFNRFCKTELTFDEWYSFLTDLCETKGLNQETVEFAMTNTGLPGAGAPVVVPQYRAYFDTFKPKSKLLF